MKLVLEPIWEAELEPNAYGYRPGKSAQDAIRKVDQLLDEGYTDVVDADLSKYFDTIPHSELLQCVARRIVDRQMPHLIKMWLKVPDPEGAPERDENGKRRLTGGKDHDRGTPDQRRRRKAHLVTGSGRQFVCAQGQRCDQPSAR